MEYIIEDGILIQSSLYFIVRCIRLLFVYDINSKKVKIIGRLPEGGLFDITDGVRMYLWHKMIVFTPMGSDKIWLFDYRNEEWSNTIINIPYNDPLGKQLFVSYLFFDTIILVGCHYPSIIFYNIKEGEEKTVFYENTLLCSVPYCDRHRYIIYGDYMLIPLICNNFVIEISLGEKFESRMIKNESIDDIINECYYNNNIGRYLIGDYIASFKEDYYLYAKKNYKYNMVFINNRWFRFTAAEIKQRVLEYIEENNVEKIPLLNGITYEKYSFDVGDFCFFCGL